MSRKLKILGIFIAVVAIGYGITLFSQSSNAVPQSFTDSRTQQAAIASAIVATSNQSASDLQKINQLDQQGDYTDALAMTTNLVTQSQTLRDQAIQLSNQVSDMTQSLSSISSLDARQAALESISSRLALINEIISYSNDLDKLLATLQNHFTGKLIQPHDVETLINQINTDAAAINNFNTQSTQAMQQFDSITSKE